MDKQDRRVKRTQNLLAKALIALTLEQGYDAITIREITQRADVGYATFFRHYHDKDELLQDVLEVVLDELMHVFFASSYQGDPSADGLILFRYVQQHSEVIRVLLSSQGSSSLIPRIIEAVSQDVLSRQKLEESGVVPAEIAAHHLITSSITLVQWWLEHDMSYTPERMGEIYQELIIRPTVGIGREEVRHYPSTPESAIISVPSSSSDRNN